MMPEYSYYVESRFSFLNNDGKIANSQILLGSYLDKQEAFREFVRVVFNKVVQKDDTALIKSLSELKSVQDQFRYLKTHLFLKDPHYSVRDSEPEMYGQMAEIGTLIYNSGGSRDAPGWNEWEITVTKQPRSFHIESFHTAPIKFDTN